MSMNYAPEAGSAIARTGALIWENLYEASVPYVETISAEDLKRRGLPTVGNRDLDRQMNNDLVNVVITIDAMVEYFRRGVTVRLRNGADAKQIYDIVNNYLLAWKEQIETCINVGNVPSEDLMLLDRFAEMIFPVAKRWGATPTPAKSFFENFFTANGAFVTRNSLFAKPKEGEISEEQEAHVSQSNALAAAIANLQRSWN